MDWPKDRKKAFLWAAEAFGTPGAERTEKQKDLTDYGICKAIHILTNSLEGSIWLQGLRYDFGIETLFWWPVRNWVAGGNWRTIHDKQRSLFCYLMAALSEKEFEKLQA